MECVTNGPTNALWESFREVRWKTTPNATHDTPIQLSKMRSVITPIPKWQLGFPLQTENDKEIKTDSKDPNEQEPVSFVAKKPKITLYLFDQLIFARYHGFQKHWRAVVHGLAPK